MNKQYIIKEMNKKILFVFAIGLWWFVTVIFLGSLVRSINEVNIFQVVVNIVASGLSIYFIIPMEEMRKKIFIKEE